MKDTVMTGSMTSSVPIGAPHFLPRQVTEVPKDLVRRFPHSKRVGHYLLGRTLGEGSFAKVKEAIHLPTGEKVAVKVIDKKRAKSDSYVRRNLRREGKLLQTVRHPNVVQLLEVMETENSYYLVTELCHKGDLMDYICKRKKLDERETKKFIRQIVSAVDYLHRNGILHRDLKIENLLLDENNDIKIIDFGLSNSIKVSVTSEGTRAEEFCVTQCGSPAYAAPELLSHKKYGTQVDVWSVGVNMYAMLTGNLPFTVEPFNIKTLHNKMMTGQMNPVPDTLSRECRDLLRRLLNPDPDRRITIAEAMRHPWLAEGRNKPLARAAFPNKLKTEELETGILKHMSEYMHFRLGEVIKFVTGNVPSTSNSTYHLINRKLMRFTSDQRMTGKATSSGILTRDSSKVSVVLQDASSRRGGNGQGAGQSERGGATTGAGSGPLAYKLLRRRRGEEAGERCTGEEQEGGSPRGSRMPGGEEADDDTDMDASKENIAEGRVRASKLRISSAGSVIPNGKSRREAGKGEAIAVFLSHNDEVLRDNRPLAEGKAPRQRKRGSDVPGPRGILLEGRRRATDACRATTSGKLLPGCHAPGQTSVSERPRQLLKYRQQSEPYGASEKTFLGKRFSQARCLPSTKLSLGGEGGVTSPASTPRAPTPSSRHDDVGVESPPLANRKRISQDLTPRGLESGLRLALDLDRDVANSKRPFSPQKHAPVQRMMVKRSRVTILSKRLGKGDTGGRSSESCDTKQSSSRSSFGYSRRSNPTRESSVVLPAIPCLVARHP